MKKRILSLVMSSLLLTLTLTACSGTTPSETKAPSSPNLSNTDTPADAALVLKCGHVLANDSHFDVGVDKFAELVKEKSGGAIQIEVYPSGVLGQEREMMESLQLGNLDLALVSTAPISNFSPQMSLLDMPYLFQSKAHAYAVLDGEIGGSLFQALESKGMVGLCYMENGFRNIFSTTPILKPTDLSGVKIRIMENAIQTATFDRFGSIVTNMASGEVYTALQQKTIDAAENAICAYYSSAYYEVCKDLSLTEHFYGATALLTSQSLFTGLTAEQQDILKEAAAEARDYQRTYVTEHEQEYLDKLKSESGVTVHTEVDKDAFRTLAQPIYEQFYNTVPKDLITAVQDCSY